MLNEYRAVVEQLNEAFDEYGILITNELKELDRFHLTSQQEMMMIHISKHERITANEISLTFGISKSAVSQVLTKLEQQEMIVRVINPANRREAFIMLGKKGKKYAAMLEEVNIKLIEKYFSKIRLEDLKHMTETMKDINVIIKRSKES
ncbi:MarR family transcriptional regulator [Aneurinibacillus migulanus]|uniref:MarR family winged helix-turn-helix transcriptional regulator n=1 Tax=Aneurinibacillus migulanus TaxID=47500 RepID=UPI0005BAD224|nr:MarR family transcriptional regulator [Aneurinibacillus migulanus]KIV56820.1 MarR family transcriptional regulator [Aneurinibacillus migulanus]KPD08587.1 MarR family transcriptional regulator [Aneurinibacillus migulanus]CEH28990.1 MarR family transcriptional regulator [Aneurinibacillus migulanus]